MSEELAVVNEYERSDGTKVIEYENGDVEERFSNGDVKFINPKGLEVYDSADHESGYLKFPDGSGFWHDAEGNITVIYDDGAETHYTSEAIKIKEADGKTISFKPDGTKTAEFPDGTKYQENPDGSEKLYVSGEGGFQMTPDGREHYKFSDGNEKWIHPDGRTVYFIADEKEYVTCTGPSWTHSWKIAVELAKRDIKKMMGF